MSISKNADSVRNNPKNNLAKALLKRMFVAGKKTQHFPPCLQHQQQRARYFPRTVALGAAKPRVEFQWRI
jgi:hypothetical protein